MTQLLEDHLRLVEADRKSGRKRIGADEPSILAVCHDCRLKHLYRPGAETLYEQMGQWREKHPPGRCQVDYFAALGEQDIVNRVHKYGHNADVKIAYGTSVDYVLGLHVTPLASSSTFTSGRESTVVSNTSNFLDFEVGGFITVGTTPTTNTSIRIYLYGLIDDDPSVVYPDTLTGADSDRSLTAVDMLGTSVKLFEELPVLSTTSNRKYSWSPRLISGFIGLKRHGLFVTHNTAVALNSTAANHQVTYKGVFLTSI